MTHTIDETRGQVRAAGDRVASKARDAMDAARSTLQDGVDAVRERKRVATDWAGRQMDAARQMPADLVNRGAGFVRERPFAMLGLALAIGLVIGRLMASDMSSRRDRSDDPYGG